jgi:hypothetical protein
MEFRSKRRIAVLVLAAGAAAFARAAQTLGPSYRAIGTGRTCDEAMYNARHAARIWRMKNCPVSHISAFASDDGFDPLDPKAYKVPDERVRCMKNGDEFYVYRDVVCVAAPAAHRTG